MHKLFFFLFLFTTLSFIHCFIAILLPWHRNNHSESLSGRNHKDLPMQAAHLPALEALYVSYNKLGSLSGAMAETTVPYIDLSHNGIKSVSAFVK